MRLSDFFSWFWPAVAGLLAVVWLWTVLQWRREQAAKRSAGALPHERVEAEDLLKAAYAQHGTEAFESVADLARAVGLCEPAVRQGMEALVAFGWAEDRAEGGARLTEEGEARAQELIRAHRLWERYLVDQEGMALDAVHAEAHHREHTTTAAELERLDAELEHPAWDPHGHAIPAPSCQVPSSPGRPLSQEAEEGSRLRIVCLDDASTLLLAQLVALGLRPGVEVTVVDREADVLRLRIDGEGGTFVIPVARSAADYVFVVPAPALPLELGRLPVGAQAQVVEIRGGGKHQRRMLDMGFVPGAEVTVVRKASLGDPIEYRIKGTGIAMRRADANSILVQEAENG